MTHPRSWGDAWSFYCPHNSIEIGMKDTNNRCALWFLNKYFEIVHRVRTTCHPPLSSFSITSFCQKMSAKRQKTQADQSASLALPLLDEDGFVMVPSVVAHSKTHDFKDDARLRHARLLLLLLESGSHGQNTTKRPSTY